MRNREEDISELHMIKGEEYFRIRTHGQRLVTEALRKVNTEPIFTKTIINFPKSIEGAMNPNTEFGQKILSKIGSCNWVDNNCLLRDMIFKFSDKCDEEINYADQNSPRISIKDFVSCDYNAFVDPICKNINENARMDNDFGDEFFGIFDATSPFDVSFDTSVFEDL